MLYVVKVEQSSILVSRSCDEKHTVESKNCNFVVKMKNRAIVAGWIASRICSIDIRMASDNLLVTTDVSGDMLSVLNTKLVHADVNATMMMD